jgi:CheY-like chemotaxis protein/AraC-like DNA-binding protein
VFRYLRHARDLRDGLEWFQDCVRDMLRSLGITDPRVQQALAIIEKRYADPALTQREVALAVGALPSTFCVQFGRVTGLTFSDYLRTHRLNEAATLLATSTCTIKEVWAAVGYNYASNFDHDFKRQFGLTPREHRARVGRRASAASDDRRALVVDEPPPHDPASARPSVLIVDDDAQTRGVVSAWLRTVGYDVTVASDGGAGLELAMATAPDVILLDDCLPDTDGLTFLRTLRRLKRTEPGVVLFTADWDIAGRQDELRSLGATVFLKPCELDDIARALEDLVCRATDALIEDDDELAPVDLAAFG